MALRKSTEVTRAVETRLLGALYPFARSDHRVAENDSRAPESLPELLRAVQRKPQGTAPLTFADG
jgi:hypothetical protein